MPLPMILMAAVLIGWPLVQIASVLAVRGRRARMRALATALKADPSFRRSDWALLERSLAESHGDAASVIAPVALPLAILAAALAELFGRERPSLRSTTDAGHQFRAADTLADDGRLQELQSLAFEVSFMRRPVTSLVTIATCLPVLPVYLVAYGLRETLAVVPRATTALVRGIRFATLDIQGALGR